MNTGYRWQDGDLLLELHVQPGARQSGFAGVHAGALKVRIAAPPVDGRANRALVAFLAETFAVARRQVAIEQGAAGRRKRVRITAPGRLPAAVAPPPGAQ